MKNNFNNNHFSPRILIAPLDWGLGHATRCIPIVKELILLGCEVIIVADKNIFTLLEKEFPSSVFIRYQGYEIVYNRKKKNFNLTLLFQFPRLFLKVIREKKWLDGIIKSYSIDAVISDNRFGMYSKKVPSIYITHQINIQTGNPFSGKMATAIHSYFIRKYKACWIPDFKNDGLAGVLSHPTNLPNEIYIGGLSRFKISPHQKIIYDLLITLSGPEPSRSIFERVVLQQLKTFRGSALVVRGLPLSDEVLPAPNDSVIIFNHLSSSELNEAMEQSKMVIARSGYTTVMDLSALNKKAVLVPTPGQSEQEYLAHYLHQKKYFMMAVQEEFSLNEILKKAESFPFREMDFSMDDYRKTINEFVLSLKSVNFAPQ